MFSSSERSGFLRSKIQTWLLVFRFRKDVGRPSHKHADGDWDELAPTLIGELIISKHPVFKCSNILQTGSERKEEEEELERISETSQTILAYLVSSAINSVSFSQCKIGSMTRCQF